MKYSANQYLNTEVPWYKSYIFTHQLAHSHPHRYSIKNVVKKHFLKRSSLCTSTYLWPVNFSKMIGKFLNQSVPQVHRSCLIFSLSKTCSSRIIATLNIDSNSTLGIYLKCVTIMQIDLISFNKFHMNVHLGLSS